MNTLASWSKSYDRSIATAPQAVWRALADTVQWNVWNPGVKSIRLDGPFATGTWFSMELPDGEVIRSELVDVQVQQGFTDVCQFGETQIRVEHHIEDLGGDQCRVVYTIRTQGPGAQEIGEAVSADFPSVLAGLEKYVIENKAA